MGGPLIQVRTRKYKSNPLLGRKQFVVDIVHPGSANVSKADVRDKLASIYKVKDTKCISVFGFHTTFGGGRSTGFGLIYDSQDKAKQFEPKHRLKRMEMYDGDRKPRIGRRNLKKMKGEVKKVRGKKKTAALKAAGALA